LSATRCGRAIARDPHDGAITRCPHAAVAEVVQMWGLPYDACEQHTAEAEADGLAVYRYEVTP
jgi:hypothetical protein